MEQFYLIHSGILGMKWGVRRFQNPDGTLTEAGKQRYYNHDGSLTDKGRKWKYEERQKRLKHPELMTKQELDEEVSRQRQEAELKKYTEKKSKEYQKLEKEIEMLELKAKKKRLKNEISGKSGKGQNGNKGKKENRPTL